MKTEIIKVHKLDHEGNTAWSYPARVLHRTGCRMVLEAEFDRGPVDVGRITLNTGDHFREYFYTDRWYNVFRISSARTGELKGWYCNFTRPAVFNADGVQAEDLALDLLIYPDGSFELLDEDEYEALELSADEREQVQRALDALLELARGKHPPFSLDTSGDT